MSAPSSLAFAWLVAPEQPGAEQAAKGQRAQALRKLRKELGRRGLDYDQALLRELSPQEVQNLPAPYRTRRHGVEVQGFTYPLR